MTNITAAIESLRTSAAVHKCAKGRLARPQPGALSPRAVAVLVALRRGTLTTAQIRNAIADDTIDQTRALLRSMSDEALIVGRSGRWWRPWRG